MIVAERANYPVALMCRCLEVSCSGFYAWLKAPLSDRNVRDNSLAERIREIRARTHEPYGRSVTENVLNREFTVDAPNKVWVGDITYIRTLEGWLYLAVLIDLYSRRVVGWSMADHMRTELPLDALKMAMGNRDTNDGLLHHSDRGCQYTSREYQQTSRRGEITSSMSRAGNCIDNAVAESFNGTAKTELFFDRPIPETKEAARVAVEDYIELFYNRERRHSTIGYLSPVEFEARYHQRAAMMTA